MSPNIRQEIQFAPPKIDEPRSKNNNNNGGEFSGGWNFIDALTNPSNPHQKPSSEYVTDTDKVYVHPLVKRSASMLSDKSLAMCTESLGSETGSDTSSDDHTCDNFSSKLSSQHNSKNHAGTQTTLKFPKKICRHADSFPPPLTSISGPGGCVLRVNSHREDGRLVIKAVSVPTSKNFFHAERVNGRLTLRFVSEKPDVKIDEGVDAHDETQRGEIEGVETVFDDSVLVGDIDVINENLGGKIVKEKFQTSRRCKQNGPRMIKERWNLEAHWVASS